MLDNGGSRRYGRRRHKWSRPAVVCALRSNSPGRLVEGDIFDAELRLEESDTGTEYLSSVAARETSVAI